MDDFKHIEKDEQELLGTLELIKRQGNPYSTPEPDPVYWANFRVRLNERIAAEPEQGILAKLRAWVLESGLRTGLIGGALAATVLGVTYFGTDKTSTETPTVAQNERVVGTTEVTPDNGMATTNPEIPNTQVPTISEQIATRTPEQVAGEAAAPGAEKTLENEAPTVELAETDVTIQEKVLLASNESAPVSLTDLSESELEDLLTVVESMN